MNSAEAALRRERRAKMAELQRQLDPTGGYGGERTSAPSVRQVGQFEERYGAADMRAREEPVPQATQREKQLFYGGGKRPKVRNSLLD